MKAGEIVDRIRANMGVPWRENTFRDIYKFGGPDTEVTGIATTMFLSIDVIERAVAQGLNMLIPHETTFWNDRDDTAQVDFDPLYSEKVELLRRNNGVIFRMHDHVHDQRPDFTYVAAAREVGLDPQYETAPNSHIFVIPETTLGELAAGVQRGIGARAMRVAGDPDARVSRIQLGVGYATPNLTNPDVHVIISGEQQETDGGFDSPAYAVDAPAAGVPRGWIMLGHNISEEGGMLDLSEWMKGFISEVPIRFIRTGEPFWAPR